MASKRKTLRRVRKALTKYVRGNAGPHSFRKTKRAISKLSGGKVAAREWQRRMKDLIKERGGKMNPPKVKGRKVKGGRAVSLKNFTGTIVRRSDGTVRILGKGRKK
jgi:hypothetical protein